VPESVIDRIGSVDNPMSVRRTSGTLAKQNGGARRWPSLSRSGRLERLRPRRCGAGVVEDVARPLVDNQVAKPVAGQGEIVVRVETSGRCHTDLHAAHGDWPLKPSPPFIP
jgi:hypothetical protein